MTAVAMPVALVRFREICCAILEPGNMFFNNSVKWSAVLKARLCSTKKPVSFILLQFNCVVDLFWLLKWCYCGNLFTCWWQWFHCIKMLCLLVCILRTPISAVKIESHALALYSLGPGLSHLNKSNCSHSERNFWALCFCRSDIGNSCLR